jgi:hypothetical protein
MGGEAGRVAASGTQHRRPAAEGSRPAGADEWRESRQRAQGVEAAGAGTSTGRRVEGEEASGAPLGDKVRFGNTIDGAGILLQSECIFSWSRAIKIRRSPFQVCMVARERPFAPDTLLVKYRCISAYHFTTVLSLLLPYIIILFLHLLSTNHKCTQHCYFPLLLKPAAQKVKMDENCLTRSSRLHVTPVAVPVELWSLLPFHFT